jgi:transitional endoplasmic reticulum ATPase
MNGRNHSRPPRRFLKGLRRRPGVYRRVPEEYRTQVVLWMLRMLVLTNAVPGELPEEEWFVRTVGLNIASGQKLTDSEAISLFREKLAEMERTPLRPEGVLYANIDRLAELIGLTPVDKELLAFLVLLHTQTPLWECGGAMEDLTVSTAMEAFAEILGLDRAEVRRALKEDGPLCSSGLVRVDRTETEMVGMFDLLEGLDAILLGEVSDNLTMFQLYFAPTPPSSLVPADFPHLREEYSLLQSILATAIKERRKGVNILVYGETGTGKTEFVKTRAASLNTQLMGISHENEDSDLEETHGRFRSYLFAQKVLARTQASVILFDEVEDVFPDSELPFFGPAKHSGCFKSWTNDVLESNPRPAFWVCNEIHQIDPAFLRRFSYALHIPTPIRSVRRSILAKYLGDLPVSQDWVDRLAMNQYLTPALIEQACKMAVLAGAQEPAALERLMERVLHNSFEVLGRRAEFKSLRPSTITKYSLDFLNPSHDLSEVVQGLKQRPAGRLLLYGPPGSGKTAFAQYIVEHVDKQLIQPHASDILNPFVGLTEKYISEMFHEASREHAVLLLDEADNFLQNRQSARRSWEVTQVNELLVQIDAFEGILLCSTNLMDSLDPAVLRRFELKISFGYLKQDQAWKMFRQTLEGMGCRPEDTARMAGLRQQLHRLTNLTPGDFATVIRQTQVLGKPLNDEQLLAALEEECRAKDRSKTQVRGFSMA